LVDGAFEFGDAVGQRLARGLRQLTHRDEVLWIQAAHPVNEIVAVLRPMEARHGVANVVSDGRRARGGDGDVGAALTLELALRVLEAFANLIVADFYGAFRGDMRRVFQP